MDNPTATPLTSSKNQHVSRVYEMMKFNHLIFGLRALYSFGIIFSVKVRTEQNENMAGSGELCEDGDELMQGIEEIPEGRIVL